MSSYTLHLFFFFFLSDSQELQAEVNAHKQQAQRVLDKGRTMIVDQHPSSQQISVKCQELVAAWQGLEKACEERMKQLQHSVGFQEVQALQKKAHTVTSSDKQENQSITVNNKTALLGLVFTSVVETRPMRMENLGTADCSPLSRVGFALDSIPTP